VVIKLNWVALACDFNLVNMMLIINESSICAVLHSTLLQLDPCYYGMHIIIFPYLLSTNHKCTQLCYFSSATQTYSSEVEEELEYFDMVF
jgi:hypothetical protein